ncbi:hypothetical protein D3C80_1252890 [compost metagenome]
MLAITGHSRLITHAGGQVADGDADDQHDAEGQQILHIADGKRPFRLDEKQVKTGDVDHRRQHRRPAAEEQRDNGHAKQVDHHQIGLVEPRQQPLGQQSDQGAECDGDGTATQLHTPFLAKVAAVVFFAWLRGAVVFQRDNHQIEVRTQLAEAIGKAAA